MEKHIKELIFDEKNLTIYDTLNIMNFQLLPTLKLEGLVLNVVKR